MAKTRFVNGNDFTPQLANRIYGGGDAATWQAGTAYGLGQLIEDANGKCWRCIVAGTSGGSAPTWPGAPTVRQQVTDGSVTWEHYQGMLCDGREVDGSQPKVLLTGGAEITGVLPLSNLATLTSDEVQDGSVVGGSSVSDALTTTYNRIVDWEQASMPFLSLLLYGCKIEKQASVVLQVQPGQLVLWKFSQPYNKYYGKVIDTGYRDRATNVAWNEGGSGGIAGTVTAAAWVHVFVIFRSSDNTYDIGFDTNPGAANLLNSEQYAGAVGFDYFRRVGSVMVNSSGEIQDFVQLGNRILYSGYHLSSRTGKNTASAELFAPESSLGITACPYGIPSLGIFNIKSPSAGTLTGRVYDGILGIAVNNSTGRMIREDYPITAEILADDEGRVGITQDHTDAMDYLFETCGYVDLFDSWRVG